MPAERYRSVNDVFGLPSRCSTMIAVLLLLVALSTPAFACPFCVALEPTLAQRRDAADAVLIGEAESSGRGKRQRFSVHSVLKGPSELRKHASISIESEPLKAGALAILFGNSDDKARSTSEWQWTCTRADEALLGYFARAPHLRQPPQKRLAYFVQYLEHANREIARDACLEFAHAPFEDLLTVADRFDFAAVRRWLLSSEVPDARKGFYGVVLGTAQTEKDRSDNATFLERLMTEDHGDFRAGFDGMLAAYLLLRGADALDLIDRRYLAAAQAKPGDLRHAASALRFYYEYGPKDLRERLAQSMAPLVDRPELAAAAITDLARWQHWQSLNRVAALYDQQSFADGPTRRAVVGYLKACPEQKPADALDRIRKRDPAGVDAAEKWLLLRGGN